MLVHLDLRHLGAEKLHERLSFICELAKAYIGVDPVTDPIPVRPTTHYTMGGIITDQKCETSIKGLFAVGECSSVGLHGANRLGYNSLVELVVFGRLAGEEAAKYATEACPADNDTIESKARDIETNLTKLLNQKGKENWAIICDEMGMAMEERCGIYRTPELMQKNMNKLAELKNALNTLKLQIIAASLILIFSILSN